MSWKCTGATNAELVSNLFHHGLIKSTRVRDALAAVDRAHFAPQEPYADTPQRIGYDATISAPHMHASATEALLPYLGGERGAEGGLGKRVLDVGCGSGYLCAVFAQLVTPNGGRVVGVEHIPQLCALSERNLRKSPAHARLLDEGAIQIVAGDGRLGFEAGGPYDAIHVGAAAPGFPQALIDQLKAPGRMFIPVEDKYAQYIWVVDKDIAGKVTKTKTHGVMYVPLTDARVFSD